MTRRVALFRSHSAQSPCTTGPVVQTDPEAAEVGPQPEEGACFGRAEDVEKLPRAKISNTPRDCVREDKFDSPRATRRPHRSTARRAPPALTLRSQQPRDHESCLHLLDQNTRESSIRDAAQSHDQSQKKEPKAAETIGDQRLSCQTQATPPRKSTAADAQDDHHCNRISRVHLSDCNKT